MNRLNRPKYSLPALGVRKSVVRTWITLLIAASVAILCRPAHAQSSLYWSGTNTWSEPPGNDFWSATSGSPSYTNAWSDGDIAAFQGTVGTVTVSGTISSVYSMAFNTDGYTLSGGMITLSGTGGDITTGAGADTINSVIAGSVGLTNLGSGTLILGAPNTYTGPTLIQNGTLTLGTSTGSDVGSIPATSSVVLGSNSGATAGVLQLGDSSNAVSQTVASLTNSGAAAGSAVVGGNAAVSTLTINNGSLDTYNGNLGGSGTNQNQLGITKIGGGTLAFGGAATNAGPTVISNGTLRVTTAGAPNLLNGSFENPVISANSYLYYNDGSNGLSAAQQTALVWTAGGNASGMNFGPALINSSSAWGYTTPYPNGNQAMSIQSTSYISQNLTFSAAGTYTLSWSAEARSRQTNPGIVLFNGVSISNFADSVSNSWTQYSTTLIVATPGTYPLEFEGTTLADQSYALQDIVVSANLSPYSQLQIASGASLDLHGTLQTVLSLANSTGGGGSVTSSVAGASFLVVSPAVSTSATFTGAIQNGSGTVGLTMNGAGTQILSGANTYTGPTVVNSGTLSLSGSVGPVTVNASGALTPGVAGTISTLSTGDVNLAAGSTLNYTLGRPSVGSLISAGALTLPTGGSPITVNFTNNANANSQGSLANGIYPLINYTSLTGGVSSSFNSTFAGVFASSSVSGKNFSFINTGAAAGSLDVVVTQSPLIYQDTFNRTGNLTGSSPTIQTGTTNAWTGGSWTTATTSGGEAVAVGSAEGSEQLAFSPVTGNVYTFSANVSATGGTSTNWLAMGFANSGATAADNIANASTLAWMLLRYNAGSPEIFYGGGADNGMAVGGPYSELTNNGVLTMVLDTRNGLSSSTVYWLVNGTQAYTAAGVNMSAVTGLVLGMAAPISGGIQNLSLSSGSTWLATSAATGGPSGTGSWSNAQATNDTGSTFAGSQLSGWSAGLIPNSAGATATFGTSIGTVSSTVTLDAIRTVGELVFANSTPGGGNYTIAQGAAGTLTLDNAGAGAGVTNYYGANVISAPVSLNDNLQAVIANGTSLTIPGPISDTGSHTLAVNPTGATGNLSLTGANDTPGATNIYGGTLTISGTGSNSGGGAYALIGGSSTPTLTINTSGMVAASTLSMGTGATVNLTAGTLALTGNLTSSGTPVAFNFGGGTLRNGNSGSTAISIGAGVPINISGATAVIDTTGGNINSSAAIAGTSGTLTVQGGNTLSLSSANSFTGSIAINAGTLKINAGANIESPSVSVAAGATLQLAGSTAALPATANITMAGNGNSGDGALKLTGASTQTVGVISSTAMNSGGAATYAGNTTVGDGTNVASLTATQILQNTLTINAGSTVTIAPSGPGTPPVLLATSGNVVPGDVVAGASSAVEVAAVDSGSDSASDSTRDPFTAIQAAIASGSISGATGQRLENRLTTIEQLAATDPGLDVSLLESRILAALPSPSLWSSGTSSPLNDSGSSLLAVDSGPFDSSGSAPASATATVAPTAGLGGATAVPEPSTLLLAALGGIGSLLSARRRADRRN